MKLTVRLTGNKLGLQKVYLRADENLNRYLAVYIFNNVLYAAEKNAGVEQEIFKLDLDKHDGKEVLSVPQDKKAAEMRELETFIKYADSAEQAKFYAEQLKDKRLEYAPTVAEGAEEYLPELSVHTKGDRVLALSLKGNKIDILIDDKTAVKDLQIANTKPGAVYLETAWGGYGWSQRNLADDVYDGVFEKLIITENRGAAKEAILFDGGPQGYDAVKFKVKKLWDSLINWFVVNL
ncbi:hypothetical protein SDC9_99579 [bioreactor metagenome]|uniref:Uncharacterized protein n=1 Tax=bioreactor metagenome TaxID=1076179 RepID=A0A645AIQ4_9ZZZZ